MLARPSPSDKARAHRSIGLLETLRGQPSLAIPHFKEAIAYNESVKETYSAFRNRLFLASAHEMAGDLRNARVEIDRAFQTFTSTYLDAYASSRLARALLRHGQNARAALVLDSLRVRVVPGNNADRAQFLLAFGMMTWARGARDSAQSLIQQAAALDSSAEILGRLAFVRAEAGESDEAIRLYRRVRAHEASIGFEAQFEWSLARYRLAQLYERLNRLTDARREYEVFLGEWPEADTTLPAVIDARAQLKKLLTLQSKPEA
jgi:tetratricopeptide (TPR) repeat protein